MHEVVLAGDYYALVHEGEGGHKLCLLVNIIEVAVVLVGKETADAY